MGPGVSKFLATPKSSIHKRETWSLGPDQTLKRTALEKTLQRGRIDKLYTAEKRWANHVSDQRLASRIYKEISKPGRRNINNAIRKWAEGMDSHPTGDGLQRASKPWKAVPHQPPFGKRSFGRQCDIAHTNQNGESKNQWQRPVLVRIRGNWTPRTSLVGMHFLTELNVRPPCIPHLHPGAFISEKWSLVFTQNLYTNVQHSFVCNRPKPEATQTSFNRLMVITRLRHRHTMESVIEWTMDKPSTLDRSGRNDAEQKKPIPIG